MIELGVETVDGRAASAAITGAASGIGRELAIELARSGWNLHLADIDATGLERTATDAIRYRCGVATSIVDVSLSNSVYEWARSIPKVDSIFNVAGVLYSGDVKQIPLKDLENVMAVNFWGVVYGSRAFFDHIQRSPQGRIVNVSSAFGMMSAPGYAAYNASKFAVRGFTESLVQELRMTSKTARATCVFPGGVKTSIARAARVAPGVDAALNAAAFDRHIARTSARQAALKIIAGSEKGKARVLVGPDARFVDYATRALGANYQWILPAMQSLRRHH